MSRIRVDFMEIIDLTGGKHQIKSTDYQKNMGLCEKKQRLDKERIFR